MRQAKLRRFGTFLLLLVPLLTGCGSSSPATVSGTVTLDGEPLPQTERRTGSIMFFPTGGGAAPYGMVADDGTYSMQTGGSQGLEVGEYVVTVRVVDIDPPPPGQTEYQDPPESTLLTPRRYVDSESTDLKVNVEPGNNTIDLELTTQPKG